MNNISDIKKMFEVTVNTYSSQTAVKIAKNDSDDIDCITYKNLGDDVDTLGTFLIYNGLKNENIAILTDNSYEGLVSYLAVICGTGTAVPLSEKWELYDLKRYLNTTNCSGIIYSKAYEFPVWQIGNDGVTPLNTYIYLDNMKKESQFLSIEEAMAQGREYKSMGNRDYLDAVINPDETAILQFDRDTLDPMKYSKLTHDYIISRLMSRSSQPLCNIKILDLIEILYRGSTVYCETPRIIK